MMFSILKATLLGAATLATAAPTIFDVNRFLEHYNITSLDQATSWNKTRYANITDVPGFDFEKIFPGGVAPVFMAQVDDPVTEFDLCNINPCTFGFPENNSNSTKECEDFKPDDCKLAKLIEPVIAAAAAAYIPSGGPNSTVQVPKPSVPRSTALQPRQKERCPGKCAPWAAIFPFGLWFGVCVADCHIRCARGGHCP